MTTSETVECDFCGTRSVVEFDSEDRRLTVLGCCKARGAIEHYRVQRNAARGTARFILDVAEEIYEASHIKDDALEEDLAAFRHQVEQWTPPRL